MGSHIRAVSFTWKPNIYGWPGAPSKVLAIAFSKRTTENEAAELRQANQYFHIKWSDR